MKNLPIKGVPDNYKDNIKTYITQEMLKRGILASNVVYTSITHDKSILQKYFSALNKIFKYIAMCENQNENIFNLLETK